MTFTPLHGRPVIRTVWQILLVGGLGLWLGQLLSLSLFAGWARHGIPWFQAPALLILGGIALLVPWGSRRQLYCHHACPHGAAQELLGGLKRLHVAVHARWHAWLSKLPPIALAGAFLAENVRLNGLLPLKYRHGQWGRVPLATEFAAPAPAPLSALPQAAPDLAVSGRFELIIGSDILYERDEAGALAHFIDSHAAPQAEIWVVDPNRGNRAHFHRHMKALGFALQEQTIDRAALPGVAAYKGRMLSYRR
jgi:hypothetical protein